MIALVRKSCLGLTKIAVAPFVGFGRGVAVGGQAAWCTHAILVLAVLGGLWWLNSYLGLDYVVHAPSQLLRQVWLPVVFAMAYAAAVSGFFTWRVLAEPDAVSPFPEIDRAWRQGLDALQRNGVEFNEKPFVLLLGQPNTGSSELLAALDLNPTFGPVPSDSDAMIRLLANDDAVYLICHDTSLLSACSDRLRATRVSRRSLAAKRQAVGVAVEQKMPVALRAVAEPRATLHEQALATVESAVDLAYDADEPSTVGGPIAEPYRPLIASGQAALLESRLTHLLRLVARGREPELPIDAIAVVIPCDATEEALRSDEVANALRQDLDTIGAVAGIRCPVVAIGSELQHVEGCGRLLHALSTDQKRRQLGVWLPTDGRRSEAALRESIDWLTRTATPALCQRLLEVEADNSQLADNSELFRFQSQIAQRSDRLAELLLHGLSDADANGEGWPLTGCYLVATGDAVGGSEAFGAGVLATVTSASGEARWTADSRQRDKCRNQIVVAGYAGLAATSLLVVGLLMAA